jgi:hypothetical protein
MSGLEPRTRLQAWGMWWADTVEPMLFGVIGKGINVVRYLVMWIVFLLHQIWTATRPYMLPAWYKFVWLCIYARAFALRVAGRGPIRPRHVERDDESPPPVDNEALAMLQG